MKINNRKIGPNFPPYVIAEMSANHNGNIENAFRIIQEAQKAGADAVKLQTYRPETMTLNLDSEEFQVHGGLWDGRTLYELYEEAHMPWEWHAPLFEYARKLGITIFSTPFDSTAVDLLEDINTPAYKIASFEVVDLPLIRYVASTGKPMVISTGMADEQEIQEAIEAARDAGCNELSILHCVSGYPSPAEDYNLRTIPDLIERFGVVVGLSDHTLDNTTALVSVAMGASIIEKHFTLDRNGGGADDSFSMEPADLVALCKDCKKAWMALGNAEYGLKLSEKGSVKFRRSLYFVKDLNAGDIVTADSVKSVRPGFGLPPKYFGDVIGLPVNRDVSFGTPCAAELLEGFKIK